ncbi:MAG: [protein-PII] uridylyltransferase, partial [Rhizomicrobium sp.]|nr:[protein-PII] uridylyltransferase [Rhizomicrobium sp.]
MSAAAKKRLLPLDGVILRQDLSSLGQRIASRDELRKEALVLVKGAFQNARSRIKDQVMMGTLHGLAAARQLSAVQDSVIQVLCDFAVKEFYPPSKKDASEQLTVVATGGYGRGELAPGSDVDLLFIRPFKPTSWDQHVIEFILYMLWDLGLKVGHATRSLPECVRLSKQDITIRTALLEARYLWGDESLYNSLRKMFWSEIATGSGQDFVEAKLAERDERHRAQGESRYLVEPNIKEGKGGLRDLQTLYWIGKYLYHVYDAADLVAHNVFTQEEFETFQNAEAFLWDVRVKLHYLMGRAEERLSFDAQPGVAAAMGYTSDNPREAVENFMRAYFLVAKDVGGLTRIFCKALEVQNRKRRRSIARIMPGFLRLRANSDDFFVETGRLNARPDAFKRDPVNFLRLFHTADTKGIGVHPDALRTITRSLDLIDDALRADKEANRLFLAMLCSHNDPEKSLKRMNESGVLGRFVPEFGRVVALMQFNMYHHYTVDEHLIRAVGHVASIEHGEHGEDHPIAHDVIKRVKPREVLYCAMLLHDIAKGLPGDHSEVGGDIARNCCLRWGLSEADTASVAWLVEHHLVMSDVAQRRDISDPKTVRDFVDTVQSPEILRMLLVLTIADIRAVGPGVWNGWKGQLLRELYYEAEAMMSGGDTTKTHSSRVTEAKEALEARLSDLTAEERERQIGRHYDTYWLTLDTATHERHARLLSAADNKGELLALDAVSNAFRAVTEITIYTPDHAGLFSQVTGAIAAAGGSIVDAKIFTTSDGFALDIFSVQDAEGGPFGDAARAQRLKQTLLRIVRGETTPSALFSKRPSYNRASAFSVAPRVSFDNEASHSATVIEVRGRDRVGFLYDVSTALFESGLTISSAMIATYGERV